ncbi:hypothetical protein EON64_03625 [archaeon]|nr:MAG: hypothetical protein EON64_03625 [archaeon]
MMAEQVTIRVKVTPSSIHEVEVTVNATDDVKALKTAIEQSSNLPEDKYVRLIYNGRMLAPDNANLSSFGLKDQSYIHAVVATRTAGSSSSAQQHGYARRDAEDEGVVRGLGLLQRPNTMSVRLSREQVDALRAYFRDVIEAFGQQQVARRPGESDEDYGYRAEEEWMAVQGATSEFRLNLTALRLFQPPAPDDAADERTFFLHASALGSSEDSSDLGSYRELLYGLLLGYALGFLMVFCVWDRNVPYRQKIGILLGIMLQMAGNLWARSAYDSAKGEAAAGPETVAERPAVAPQLRGLLNAS